MLSITTSTNQLQVHSYTTMATFSIGVGMSCTLGGGGGAHSISCAVHVQFMCSIIVCLIYDQTNIGGGGGAIAPPAPMVLTPMFKKILK